MTILTYSHLGFHSLMWCSVRCEIKGVGKISRIPPELQGSGQEDAGHHRTMKPGWASGCAKSRISSLQGVKRKQSRVPGFHGSQGQQILVLGHHRMSQYTTEELRMGGTPGAVKPAQHRREKRAGGGGPGWFPRG